MLGVVKFGGFKWVYYLLIIVKVKVKMYFRKWEVYEWLKRLEKYCLKGVFIGLLNEWFVWNLNMVSLYCFIY